MQSSSLYENFNVEFSDMTAGSSGQITENSIQSSSSQQLPEQEDSLLAKLMRGEITVDDPVLQTQYFDNGIPVSYVPNPSEEAQTAIKFGSSHLDSANHTDSALFTEPPAKKPRGPRNGDNTVPVLTDAVPSEFMLSNPSSDSFDTVHGRLAMGSNHAPYHVTVEEMKRRLSFPEKLNSSSLACNLKRPKTKNGGEIMRSELKDHKIELQLNKKQAVFSNKIIALTEAEAVHLALDLETVVNSNYPIKEIIEEVAQEAINNDEAQEGNIVEAMSDDKGFLACMTALEEAICSVVPPITGIHAQPSGNLKLNIGMETYSNATHGFGIIAQRIWLRKLKEIGQGVPEAIRLLEFNQMLKPVP